MKEGARYNVPGMNGFRRFCNKAMKDAKSADSTISSLIKKERMLGHRGLIDLDDNYFENNLHELAKEYLSAVQNLTIHENRERAVRRQPEGCRHWQGRHENQTRYRITARRNRTPAALW